MMPEAERDGPADPPEPAKLAEPPPTAAASPENAPLIAAIADLTARLAERDAQINALIGDPEWLELRSCNRGGYTCEAFRKWCMKGLVVWRREGTGKRSPIVLNTRSLAERLAQKGLSKAIRRR
jgi:hypothetical protein